jgi:uncharacterized protein with von Willebrand factor type A (vWA) domain
VKCAATTGNLIWKSMKRMLAERLAEQTEEHHGGNRWVGTGALLHSAIQDIIPAEYASAVNPATCQQSKWRA